ncbi:MAG: hypothetical protein GYA68_06755 [Syntrophorhabdus sp.]|nr:hypothetical protein [Syntrophorhabdus sp.]
MSNEQDAIINLIGSGGMLTEVEVTKWTGKGGLLEWWPCKVNGLQV